MELFLKENVKLEPLVLNWYAWPYLIPPHTAGSIIARKHLSIMESYLQSPEFHEEAVKSPTLIGGPFIDFEERMPSEEMEAFISQTSQDSGQAINLFEDIRNILISLNTKDKGGSLDNLYSLLPDSLRGMVEFSYDLNNNPTVQFIEPIIYNKYYTPSWQSICISETRTDYRPFSLSTPNIKAKEGLYLNIPFSSPVIDQMAAMRFSPADPRSIAEEMSLIGSEQEKFMSFFTSTPPSSNPSSSSKCEDGVRVRYFGHACVLIESPRSSILIDPVISYQYHNDISRFTFADLPETIDTILITHNHQDHILFETLLQLRHKVKNIILPQNAPGSFQDPSLKLILKSIGFHNVTVMDKFDSLKTDDMEIIALPFLGEHGDLNIHSKNSYFIKTEKRTFFFAADSNNLDPPLYQNIFSMVGKADICFIGMECVGAPMSWLYGPLLPTPLSHHHDQQRRLDGSNFEKAWDILHYAQPREVYIYALGQEPWLNYVMATHYTEASPVMINAQKLIQACKDHNITAKKLFAKDEWIYR